MAWDAQVPSCWDEYRPTKVNDECNTMIKVMQEINRDCNRSNNTSKEIEIKRQAIANITNLFRGSRHHSTSPPLPLWRSQSTKGSSTKGPYNKQLQKVYTRPEYTTPPLNPLHKR